MNSLSRRLTLIGSVSLCSYYCSSKSSFTGNSVPVPLSPLNNFNFYIGNKFVSRCENDPNSRKIVKTAENADELPILIGGSASKRLALNISRELGIDLAETKVRNFTDGEMLIDINDKRFSSKRTVFIVQSCKEPVNDSIMELLLTISCAKRAGANKVVAVVPYFGYKHHRRGSVVSTNSNSRHLTSSAMDFAKMLQEMGVDRVISVDLQRPGQGQEACFFGNLIPLESINTTEAMVKHFVDKIYKEEPSQINNPVLVIAPNPESLKKARNFQLSLKNKISRKLNLAIFNYAETATGPIDFNKLEMVGKEHKINGADVIIVDDLIDTAMTLLHLSKFLKSKGARNIYLFASHGLFTNNAMETIDKSPINKIVVSNSLSLETREFVSPKIEQLPLEGILAHAIKMEYLRSASLSFEDYKNPDDDNLEDFDDHFTADEIKK